MFWSGGRRGGNYFDKKLLEVGVARLHNKKQFRFFIEQKEQEDVFGRTKMDNVEHTDEEIHPCAHIKRVNLKDDDGKSMEILRQSMPYGDMKVQGLFFVSYCNTSSHFEKMLEKMIHSDGEGHFDHMLKYTQAETGCAFFAPSLNFLKSLA